METSLWTVVAVQPRHQDLFESAFAGMLYGVYNPRFLQTVSNPYKTYERPAHLFPGYLFVSAGYSRLAESMTSIKDERLWRFREVGKVNPDEIELIRERENAQGYITVSREVADPNAIHPGESVRVTEGAFFGHEGRVEKIIDAKIPAHQRIVMMIGSARPVAVTLPRAAVQRVKCA
jgi:transcription antitermination factor NusG